MQLNPMLSFNGDCKAAFEFYEECFGGTRQTMMTWGESPMAEQIPAEWHERIIHASLLVGPTSLLGGDAPPNRYEAPKGLSVTIQIDEPVAAERVFAALAEGGTVTMPIQETFWAARF